MKTKLQRKTATWLNKYRQDMDLEPFFQRGTVWSPNKQQYFIDSLLKQMGNALSCSYGSLDHTPMLVWTGNKG